MSQPLQVRERIPAGYIDRIGTKTQYFGPNPHFLFDDAHESGTIR